jgi:hypothetical protein
MNESKVRAWLGIGVIIISILALVLVGIKIIANNEGEDAKFVYSSLLPLVGTWVGVVLAFYFGKENYEAVSKDYRQIIDKLSPEVLDDIPAGQIMISRKTMISRKWSELKGQSIKEVRDFLMNVEKSRLPILNDKGKVIYIIHTSMLSRPEKDAQGNSQPPKDNEKMETFVKRYEAIFGQIVEAKREDKVETVRGIMNSKPGCKDVFVKGADETTIGWLTDTLILRYMNSKRL